MPAGLVCQCLCLCSFCPRDAVCSSGRVRGRGALVRCARVCAAENKNTSQQGRGNPVCRVDEQQAPASNGRPLSQRSYEEADTLCTAHHCRCPFYALLHSPALILPLGSAALPRICAGSARTGGQLSYKLPGVTASR